MARNERCTPAPRLSALLAAESNVGVVFRRGPSKRVRLVMWDRATDQFTDGPGFRGRIYVERSDISPNGRYLLYFAMGGVRWAVQDTGGTWTAISALPSLTALALWKQGNTYGGGGMFLSDNSFQLFDDPCTALLRDSSGLERLNAGARIPSYSRLERDGWIVTLNYPSPLVLEKRLPGGWMLRRHGWTGGYELRNDRLKRKLDFPQWEWAEWDRHRLVATDAGCLLTVTLDGDEPGTTRILHDFRPVESVRVTADRESL